MSNDVFCTCNGDQIYRLQIEGVLGITLPVLSTHRVGWFDNSISQPKFLNFALINLGVLGFKY